MKPQFNHNLQRMLLAGSLVTAAYLVATPFSSTRSAAEPEVSPAELLEPVEQYKIIVIGSPPVDELQKELNKQAADGWKLRTAMDKMLVFAK